MCGNPNHASKVLEPGKSRTGTDGVVRCDACGRYLERNGSERPWELCHRAPLTSQNGVREAS